MYLAFGQLERRVLDREDTMSASKSALMAGLENLTREELMARLSELETRVPTNGIKVSSKGGVSVYGLGRFPVTLYLSQWERLLGMANEIKAFIEANRGKLKVKPGKDDEA